GADITSGMIPETAIPMTITRDSEIMTQVLGNDGAGSGLDADKLDGQQAAAFAASSHSHSGADIDTGTVADARIAGTIARDSEIMPTILANDGPGSGLNADLLDGEHSSHFITTSGGDISGIALSGGLLRITSTDVTGHALVVEALGANGVGIECSATDTGSYTQYGARFSAESTIGRGVQASGKGYDFYAGGTGTNYGPFTGAHEVRLAEDFPLDITPGVLVCTAGPSLKRADEKGDVYVSSTLPTVRLADTPQDKTVLGVIVKELPLAEDHWYKPAADERFAAVNALGDGRVWACTANGDIAMGDYLTTSAVPGYAQKQDDDLQHSYTVGKVTEIVDWNAVTDTVEFAGQTFKAYLIAVVYTCG
ncbi:MAG TPA: hypothetical protein PKI11_17635, partial [Candidatus Hydrogenedentes bacterium]|nr:hypothetical protein [Candidatus Hydrogenedentota bacterium]